MFGGQVGQGIDPQWHSHASIPKTIIDLLGLPAIGVPRVDNAPSMATLVNAATTRPLRPPRAPSSPNPPRLTPPPHRPRRGRGRPPSTNPYRR